MQSKLIINHGHHRGLSLVTTQVIATKIAKRSASTTDSYGETTRASFKDNSDGETKRLSFKEYTCKTVDIFYHPERVY
jgi:hypothetical protein